MLLNKVAINKVAINDAAENVVIFATGSGLIISAESKVRVSGSGTIVSFENIVNLKVTGSGLIISAAQSVRSKASGIIISINQRVVTNVVTSFLLRNGFDFDIYIGGYHVPKSQLCGSLSIQKEASKSALCEFTLLPSLGIQNPEQFQGQSIIATITKDGVIYSSFTGYVDTPEIDLIDKKITFSCSDRRDSRLLGLARSEVEVIGKYSNEVFGEPRNQAEEVESRLSTVPYSLDFNNFGAMRFVPWAPKSVADFTLTNEDVYYNKPNVTYSPRSKILNRVDITVTYSFQRLHQQRVNISWPGYSNFLTDWFNVGTPSFPSKETINQAAYAGDWTPIRSPTFTNLWAAGFYGSVVWQPNLVTEERVKRVTHVYLPYNPSPGVYSATWPDGNKYPLESAVLDANGKEIYDVVSTTITDTSSHLCRGASWSAARKFSQNVVYTYNITVKSPQAITRFGEIEETLNVDVVDQYDSSSWENEKRVYFSADNFYIDKKESISSLVNAFDCAVRKARTSIQDAHRNASVNFRTPVWPQVDLEHTVALDTDRLSCKGKVHTITHYIDASTGEGYTDVTLLLSRSFGGDSASSLLIPEPEDDADYIGEPQTIVLGTHLGMNPDPAVTPGAESWTGYIGNKGVNTTLGTTRTQFTEAFVVDYPAIPDKLRDTRELESTVDFNIVVINDDLEVEF